MQIRRIKKNEYEELRSVWCDVFGDDPIFVDELYYALKAKGYVCEDEGKLHSFLTLFNAGEINGRKVQVSYGICTRPESRSNGYAGELVKYVRDLVVDKGDISLICPANASLVDFYSKLGYKDAFYSKFRSEEANSLKLNVKMITPTKYNKLREEYLAEYPHVKLNAAFLKFIKNDSVNAQGLLLINNGDAICTVDYGTDDEMGLSELIIHPLLAERSSEIAGQIAGGLATLFEVERVYFRAPTSIVYTDNSGDHVSPGTYIQGMIAGADTLLEDDNVFLPYYGFPID